MTDMIDMSQFTEAKSDQLNADDLIGITKTLTVTKVSGCEGDQPIAISYQGDNGKPFKPCKTMRRVLLAVWGRYANDYVGRSMTVYRDDKVTFGGLDVGGIRISHMSHIDKDIVVVVAKSKGKKAGVKISPLALPQSALTVDDARQAMNGAESLDDLRVVWSRKSMGPHREALAGLLDERKLALAPASEAASMTSPEGFLDAMRTAAEAGEDPEDFATRNVGLVNEFDAADAKRVLDECKRAAVPFRKAAGVQVDAFGAAQ